MTGIDQLPDERDLPGSRLQARREHLLNEIEKNSGRQAWHQRTTVRAVGAVFAVVVVALVVMSAVNVFGGSSIVEKAEAAIAVPSDVLLHFKTAGTQDNGDGTVVTFSDETWQLSSSPQVWRRIEVASDSSAVETAHTETGLSQIYDAAAGIIYQAADSIPAPDGPEYFRTQAADLLNSRGAKVDGHVTVDGRDAIRIVSDDGGTTYLVDAGTGEPLEWITNGSGGGVDLRITFEKQPASGDALNLVDLSKQHPTAAIDSDPQHYRDALTKGFPKG